jgi:putative hydrolase of the HAD superfamily
VPHTELLLFDLGGVLVEFSGPKELGKHLRWPSTPETILERWIQCPHTAEFERGRLTPSIWAERFITEWDVDLSPNEFLGKFTTWSRRVLPGAIELLAALRRRYRLAALSNSNELHWARNTNELRILEEFEFAISSHEVGFCKPDPAIFRLALDRAGVPSKAVVFFDDLAVNVSTARSVGLRAYQVHGVEGVRDRLIRERMV